MIDYHMSTTVEQWMEQNIHMRTTDNTRLTRKQIAKANNVCLSTLDLSQKGITTREATEVGSVVHRRKL